MKYLVLEGGMIGGVQRRRGEILDTPEGDPYGYARLSSLSEYTPPAKVKSSGPVKAKAKSTTKGKKR